MPVCVCVCVCVSLYRLLGSKSRCVFVCASQYGWFYVCVFVSPYVRVDMCARVCMCESLWVSLYVCAFVSMYV